MNIYKPSTARRRRRALAGEVAALQRGDQRTAATDQPGARDDRLFNLITPDEGCSGAVKRVGPHGPQVTDDHRMLINPIKIF
ncbi:hypothetical protein J6590_008705 [Homalodisca vitripennis]|nr:hypothetical protein J6590_008705 [Homalodisca vitripennis]